MGYGEYLVNVLSAVPSLGRALLRSYLRLTFHGANSNWIIESSKRRLTASPRTVTVLIGDGLQLEVDWNTTIGREIYFHRTYEAELATLFNQVLQPGMTVIDAGANVGELTVRAARAVGNAGRVFAIEASPSSHARLVRNIGLNGFGDRVTPLCAAVANTDGTATLFLGKGPDSLSTSLVEPSDYCGTRLEVKTLRLDDLISTYGLERVDLVKLDIEGAELFALKGAKAILKMPRPPIVIFEHNRDVVERTGQRVSEIVSLLGEVGYTFRIVGVDRQFSMSSVQEYLATVEEIKRDVIATHDRSICKL